MKKRETYSEDEKRSPQVTEKGVAEGKPEARSKAENALETEGEAEVNERVDSDAEAVPQEDSAEELEQNEDEDEDEDEDDEDSGFLDFLEIRDFVSRHAMILVTAVLTLAILLTTGCYVISRKSAIEAKQSSYKLTTFDYVIASPTREQIAEFSQNAAIQKIFPCYNFEVTTTQGVRFPVLMSDSLEGYEISLFNEDTCISGGKNENGIMLDEHAADRLNVKVGDSVTFAMGGRTVSLKVSGIYMASTYRNFEKGLGLAVFTDEMKSYFDREITYNLAFIDASNIPACETLLSTYIPLGECMTEATYIENRKKTEQCPPDVSPDAWEASMKADYLDYKTKFEQASYPYAVQVKSAFMKDVADQIETRDSDVSNISIITAIAVFVGYTALGILSIYKNKRDDRIRARNAEPYHQMLKEYVCVTLISSLVVFLLTGVVLVAVAWTQNHISACLSAILLSTLPILPAAALATGFAKLYVDQIYRRRRARQVKGESE